jgi:hypothetical protein
VALPLRDAPALIGLSGLAMRAPGEVWVAPERSGALVALGWTDEGFGSAREVPLEGVPSGVDVEAIAFVDGSHALLGTEARGPRTEDPVYGVELRDEAAVVTGALVFDYGAFGVEAEDNRGLEGACAVPGAAVVASEAVVTSTAGRHALVGVFPLDGGETAPRLVPHRIGLRSRQGKLSALACRATEEGIEVHAIERHYGTMRLVRFVLGPRPSTVEAKLVTDLAPALGQEAPNLEGLGWVGPAALAAVSDNHYGEKTGPPRAFRIDLGDAAPR